MILTTNSAQATPTVIAPASPHSLIAISVPADGDAGVRVSFGIGATVNGTPAADDQGVAVGLDSFVLLPFTSAAFIRTDSDGVAADFSFAIIPNSGSTAR